jgi:hypothetical protein
MNLFDTFKEYYDRAYDHQNDDQLSNLEYVFNNYGLDENSGDIYECFLALPEEGQREAIEILTPELELGEPGYAKSLYESSIGFANKWISYGDDGEEPRHPYEQGIVDFYEALKAEGINLGF